MPSLTRPFRGDRCPRLSEWEGAGEGEGRLNYTYVSLRLIARSARPGRVPQNPRAPAPGGGRGGARRASGRRVGEDRDGLTGRMISHIHPQCVILMKTHAFPQPSAPVRAGRAEDPRSGLIMAPRATALVMRIYGGATVAEGVTISASAQTRGPLECAPQAPVGGSAVASGNSSGRIRLGCRQRPGAAAAAALGSGRHPGSRQYDPAVGL
eukprot:scaffold3428_cov379-Prasinococcus_capsulatus_cf.AAC.35